MSNFCKTLAIIEKPETIKIVASAFSKPKYKLEFVNEVSDALTTNDHIDLLVVDSKFLNDKKVESIRHHLPTVIIEPEYIQIPHKRSLPCGDESDHSEQSEKIRIAAEKLLRKNYFNWIIDALEHSS